MARGQKVKAEIMERMLNYFPNSFKYNDGKEIRIPMEEDGEEIQIKVTLTAAKENVSVGDEDAVPTAETIVEPSTVAEPSVVANDSIKRDNDTVVEPTEQEKENLKSMLASLGL